MPSNRIGIVEVLLGTLVLLLVVQFAGDSFSERTGRTHVDLSDDSEGLNRSFVLSW